MNGSIFEVIIVGAGPAGLMCSYYLKHLGLEHILFDQGRFGESWRAQRWDSFRMITPIRASLLPGSLLKTRKPDDYGTAADMLLLLQEYVSSLQLPITEQAEVVSIEKAPNSPVFQVKVLHDNELERTYDAWQVIVAVGNGNRPHVPQVATTLPGNIDQLHAANYRSSDQLKPGAVLVVGGGQSGLEIAHDLVVQGREVYLSALPHAQVPRQYRGKEIFQWLAEARLMDTGSLTGISCTPVITYPIDDTTFLGRSSLAERGVRMLGKFSDVDAARVTFPAWEQRQVESARAESASILQAIDRYISEQNIAAPDADYEVQSEAAPDFTTLDLTEQGITTIIWATGFTSSFPDIQCPLTCEQLLNNNRGVTSLEGLYVVGASRSGSDYVVSAKEDASFVTNRIYGALR